jgi:hypothetical protein
MKDGPGEKRNLENFIGSLSCIWFVIKLEAAETYLPPYSPDFNPIEKCWSKVKQLPRAAKARSLFSLETALTEALDAVTPHHALAFFRTAVMVYTYYENGLSFG